MFFEMVVKLVTFNDTKYPHLRFHPKFSLCQKKNHQKGKKGNHAIVRQGCMTLSSQLNNSYSKL